MKDYFFNTRDDFHYDHSGYYGYIVFNGDKQTCDGLLKALGQGAQPGGLGWYRYGKSFRPANDGKMYHWYIRLHSGGSEKPAAQAVDDFLRGHLEPPKPAPQPVQPSAITAPVADAPTILLARFSALEEKLLARIEQLQSNVQAGTAAQAELEEMRETLQESQEARSAANTEIESLREIIASKQPSAIEGLNEENRDLKKSLKKNKDAHKAVVTDLRKQIHSHKQEHRKVSEELVYWKQQHEDAVTELGSLKEETGGIHGQTADTARADDRITSDELKEILDGAFPGLNLVRGSMETLHREIQNKRPVMALLHRIVNERGFNGRNAIRGNKRNTKWREDRFDEEWRAYFCKESRLLGDKVVVLLGDKNNQRQDIEWMINNPPETCL